MSEPKKKETEIMTSVGSLKQIDKYIDSLYAELALEDEKYKLKKQQFERKQKLAFKKSLYPRLKDDQSDDLPVDGDLIQGSRVFTKNCLSCHSLDSNSAAKNWAGPALGLIYGRMSASDRYYGNYTQSLLQSDKYWSARNLFNFIRNPSEYIPGSNCNYINKGLESEQDRVDLIKFLKQYSVQLNKNLRIKLENTRGKQYVNSQVKVESERMKRRKTQVQID